MKGLAFSDQRKKAAASGAVILGLLALETAMILLGVNKRGLLFASLSAAFSIGALILLSAINRKRISQRERTQRVALSGLLLAMMLVLGFVESLIPPLFSVVPGIKLGLSNGVLIFAVYMLDLPLSWVLMVLKVALSGLLWGGVSAMLYALAGGVLSLMAMSLLSRFRALHPITVSMAGGVMHNVGQVAVAMLLMHTPQLLYYMAVLTVVGMICGALTGFCASSVMKHLKAMKRR